MSDFDIRSLIVRELASGQFYSGSDLGSKLGVSRAAISKHVKFLQSLGLEIFSVTGKGYRLDKPLEVLDVGQITQKMSSPHTKVEVLNVIDSTNDYVKAKLVDLPNGFTCLAEAQTAGRGRHGRKWVSPFGSNLYMSMAWRFEGGFQALAGLSLAVGVAVTESLSQLGLNKASLKWPNDVLLNGKKLAGVLIEAEGRPDSSCVAIIGIGLNINMNQDQGEIAQPWTDLAKSMNRIPNRNDVAALLIDNMHKMLLIFQQQGLAPFVESWSERNTFANKPIKLIIGDEEIHGINTGITDSGALILESVDSAGKKVIKTYFGGEISVRGL